VPELSIEYDMLAKLKERVMLARAIDAAQHSLKKENHEDKWLRETAEALEIDVSSDAENGHDGNGRSRKRFDYCPNFFISKYHDRQTTLNNPLIN
jgi:ATP-dependent RNA helicase DDX24/MAK5